MTKTCTECKGDMKEFEAKTPEGIRYKYYKCGKCGEEILTMDQLHEVSEKYRILKKYSVKVSRWGQSLGVRIPKELAKKYHLKADEEIIIIPEKEGMKIVVK
mgnify:FL=1